MGSGKGPGFINDQLAWIKTRVPEYLSKTAYGKPVLPHHPLPEDDKDLAVWVRAHRDQFEQEFQTQLQESIDAGKTDASKIRDVRPSLPNF